MSLLADLRTAALSCAARGWYVFPLLPGSKRPALHGHQHCPGFGACVGGHLGWEQRATTDPDRITACWSHKPYNIGVACGPSGLVVIDLDTPKPDQPIPGADTWARLATEHHSEVRPWTYRVATPSGGVHHYYQEPPSPQLRNTAGRLGPGIDTRAHGGYVVGAGSITPTGSYTAELWPEPLPGLPGWLVTLLTPPPLPAPGPVAVTTRHGRAGAWLDAAIRNQLAYLASAKPRTRNHALYISAVALGQLAAGGALPESEVEALLVQACHAGGFEPRASTIASGLRAGRARPRSVAA